MSKIITDEQELNTATGELVTEDYALEILGLQSIADFRKFSRSFMKLSKIVKGIENSNNNKLDKGAVSLEYDTAKKIEDKIKKIIDEKWKMNAKYIGNTNTSTDFNSITEGGIYYSGHNNLYINGFLESGQRNYVEFKLIVLGENTESPILKTQIVIERDTNNIHLRSCTAWQAPWTWGEWEKIARMSDLTWGNIGGKPSSFPPSSHTHDDRYYTEAEINEKFKNFCPFPVNSLHLSLSNQNPSTTWLGTTWDKIEDRFLLGAGSGKYDAGTMGGNSSVSLGINNMPRHRHKVDSTSASVPAHVHSIKPPDSDSDRGHGRCATGGEETEGTGIAAFNSGSAGGGSTGSFAPYTDYQGNGSAFSIMPPYLAVNIWKRTS